MNFPFVGLLLFLVMPILFVLSIYWFFQRYPAKSESRDSVTNLSGALREYGGDHPGYVGKGVKFFLIVLWLSVIATRVFFYFQH